jgi:hypothetical protein
MNRHTMTRKPIRIQLSRRNIVVRIAARVVTPLRAWLARGAGKG